jgi:hypothetical protein
VIGTVASQDRRVVYVRHAGDKTRIDPVLRSRITVLDRSMLSALVTLRPT